MAFRFIDLPDLSSCTGFTPTSWNYSQSSSSPLFTGGVNLRSLVTQYDVYQTVFENDYLRIEFKKQQSNNSLRVYDKTTIQAPTICSIDTGWNDNDWFGIAFVVDDDTQLGGFWGCFYNSDLTDSYYVTTNISEQGSNLSYLDLTNSVAPQYTWSSVPKINSKGKLYRLTDILNINDGNAVNDVAASGNVDFSAKTKVNNLVSAVMGMDDDHTKATVTYDIQAINYEYVKLTYKKNQIPEEYDDGTPVDISDMSGKVIVENLDERSTYYFGIFTDKSTSDPYKYSTGVTPEDEGYNFAYTGTIQTFTAPKTGIYQLETWGAQGGNATDNDLVARGGYGAYAKGEVFLAQGETLYINVGGQNGYGGGGVLPECISKYMYNGAERNLVRINDYSKIPSNLKTATSFSSALVDNVSISSTLSYIETTGDMLYQVTSSTSGDDNYVFAENDDLKISFGKQPANYWDLSIYNKYTQTDNTYGFPNPATLGNMTRDYYLGVIIDRTAGRGYLIVHLRGYTTGANMQLVSMFGGIENGKDYIYELFKDQI